ncbi:MAG: glycosyltransferase [Steroidobacteraceae bacterium]
MNVRVSVIIPVHDCEEFIAAAVRSVLSQGRGDIELIVVDDGSTDGTTQALEPFRGNLELIQQRNAGPAAARNAGLRKAVGRYVAFLDADDWWCSSRLSAELAAFERYPDAGLVFSDFSVVSAGGETILPLGIRWKYPLVYSAQATPWRRLFASTQAVEWNDGSGSANRASAYRGRIATWLFRGNFINTSSVLARREALEGAGGFDENLGTEEDYDCWLRLARDWPFVYVDAPLVAFRRRAGQLTAPGQAERILRNVATVVERAATRMADSIDPGMVQSRLAAVHRALGIACLRNGRTREARRHLWRSIREQPAQAVTALLLPMTLLPASVFGRLERFVREFRNR